NFETSSRLQILYNQQSVEVQGNLKRKLITQLQPDTDYSFVLMSRGNSAGGLQQQVSIRTAPDLLKMKPVRYQHDEEGGKVTISLPRVPAGAPIRSVSSVCLRGNHTKKRMICNFNNGSEVSSLLSLSLILE
uniref:Fibronectin type-III domain-containing protein n=1 Tax=Seriola lalandi dorsalis TaxID=1841481 RepID=A0A3B4WG51_SERLL